MRFVFTGIAAYISTLTLAALLIPVSFDFEYVPTKIIIVDGVVKAHDLERNVLTVDMKNGQALYPSSIIRVLYGEDTTWFSIVQNMRDSTLVSEERRQETEHSAIGSFVSMSAEISDTLDIRAQQSINVISAKSL